MVPIMRAIVDSPRSRQVATIFADMEAQRDLVRHLQQLACEWYAIDMRPVIVSGTDLDATVVQRVGPDPVPLDLREHLVNETATLALLEHEYVLARRGHA